MHCRSAPPPLRAAERSAQARSKRLPDDAQLSATVTQSTQISIAAGSVEARASAPSLTQGLPGLTEIGGMRYLLVCATVFLVGAANLRADEAELPKHQRARDRRAEACVRHPSLAQCDLELWCGRTENRGAIRCQTRPSFVARIPWRRATQR